MAITYVAQKENSIHLYCEDFFNGYNKLTYTDGKESKEITLTSPDVLLENLTATLYKVNLGNSEKYVEVYSESLINVLDFLFNNIKPTGIKKDDILNTIDSYDLSLVEALYYLLRQKYSKDILKLLLAAISLFNSNNFYNNLDLNTSVRIKSDHNNKIMNVLVNGESGDRLHISKFVPEGYQYIEVKDLDDLGILNLSFLKPGELHQLKLERDDNITNYFYVYAMTHSQIKDIWPDLKKITDLINSRFNEEKYLPLVYQNFSDEDKKAILMARSVSKDSYIYECPILEQNEDYFVAYFDKTSFIKPMNPLYLCITDIEGLAANEILVKEPVTNFLMEIPLAGKTIYEGYYFFYLMDDHDRIVSKISIFNKDNEIEANYNEATIKEFVYDLISYLKKIYEEKDVDMYSPLFFNEVSNPLANSTNYFNLIVEKLVLTYKAEDFFDLIFDLYQFKYMNQGYKKDFHYLIKDNKAKRIIAPPLKEGNLILKSVKYSQTGYNIEYKEISDSANYVTYSDADYTVVSIFEKNSEACLGFVVAKKYGHDYYFQNWNVSFE